MNDLTRMLAQIRTQVSGKSALRYRARFSTSDVTQECAIQLINEFEKKQIDSEDHPLVTKKWLGTIGKGTASKMRRKNDAACRAVQQEIATDFTIETSQQPTPHEVAESREVCGQLVKAISRLDPVARKVLDLHYLKQKSLRNIAVELDLGTKNVQRIHQKALSKIRADLVG